MNNDSLRWIEVVFAQFWQITVVVAVVALLVRLTTKRHPHLAYALWMVALIKCLAPPLGDFPPNAWNWLPTTQIEADEAPSITAPMQNASAEAGDKPFNELVADDDRQNHFARLSRSESQMATASNQLSSSSMQSMSLGQLSLSRTTCRVVLSTWLTGTLLLLGMVWGRAANERCFCGE